MIFVTGDTHGDILSGNIKLIKRIKKNDTAIICGDFGFIWDNSKEEIKNIKTLSKFKCKILFVDGCHENHVRIKQHPKVPIFNSEAYKISDNIYCLIRGNVYTIEDKTFLAIGGGQSEDMQIRVDIDAWSNEEFITKSDIKNTFDNLSDTFFKVDYVITHEAPLKIKEFLDIENRFITSHCNILLQNVCDKIEFEKWFFGHYHMDKVFSKRYVCVYKKLLQI